MGPHMAAQCENPLKSPAARGKAKTPSQGSISPLVFIAPNLFQWIKISIDVFACFPPGGLFARFAGVLLPRTQPGCNPGRFDLTFPADLWMARSVGQPASFPPPFLAAFTLRPPPPSHQSHRAL